MKTSIEKMLQKALKEINLADKISDLEEIKINYLSRNSELNNIKKNLKDLSPDDKKTIGNLANKASSTIEEELKEKYESLYKQELNQKLKAEKIDITLPGDFVPHGKLHPITQTINEITEIFQGMGFSIVNQKNSPEVETDTSI
jgi:phenylalanyl-tRNA synthetase alpha chain